MQNMTAKTVKYGRCYCVIAVAAAILLMFPVSRADATQRNVPVPYPTIQSAINAAVAGDVVNIATGRYHEVLTITKSLTLNGLGAATNCTVYYDATTFPIITIRGPIAVTLSNFEINGGGTYFQGFYNGTSPLGIVATNGVNLTLDTFVINQVRNFMVTITNGFLTATNVALWTRDIMMQCDVGFELSGCTGKISNLTQDAGTLDHTININSGTTKHSDITIDNCRIAASHLTWGNCVRAYSNSKVKISNCQFYRNPGGDALLSTNMNHNGVGVNGYSNNITITGNTFSNLPWAIYCVGSLGGNSVVVEYNMITNSEVGGVFMDWLGYEGIDLGGGSLGSRGGNVFSKSPMPTTNFYADVMYTNLNAASTANVYAMYNTWSDPTNKENVIIDKLDNPAFGRLVTDGITRYWLEADVSGGGSVSITSAWYAVGAQVILTATPFDGCTFYGWSGATNGCVITTNQVTVPMDQMRTVTASFSPYDPLSIPTLSQWALIVMFLLVVLLVARSKSSAPMHADKKGL